MVSTKPGAVTATYPELSETNTSFAEVVTNTRGTPIPVFESTKCKKMGVPMVGGGSNIPEKYRARTMTAQAVNAARAPKLENAHHGNLTNPLGILYHPAYT